KSLHRCRALQTELFFCSAPRLQAARTPFRRESERPGIRKAHPATEFPDRPLTPEQCRPAVACRRTVDADDTARTPSARPTRQNVCPALSVLPRSNAEARVRSDHFPTPSATASAQNPETRRRDHVPDP